MFDKLKSKLKDALSIFSRKTEEAVEEKKVVPLPKEISPEKVIPKAVEKEKKEKVEEKQAKEEKVKKLAESAKEVFEKEKKEKERKEFQEKCVIKEELFKKDHKEGFAEEIPPDEVKITYFVHGTTTDNEKGKSTGWNPGELSELGIKQSKELKELIKDKHFDAVFTSDLKRAIDSAKLTFGDSKIKIIQDKRLRECNYGELNGADEEKINYLKHIDKPFPNGESNKDVENRIARFLNFLCENYKEKHIAILAHKSPQLALEVLLKNKTWEKAIKEDWRNKKAWQPGWDYELKEKIEIKEITLPQKYDVAKQKFEPDLEKIKEIEEELEKPSIKKEIKEEVIKTKKEEPSTAEEVVEKKSFFGKIKEAFTTKTISADKFDELFWELEKALLENNVSVEVIEKIKEDLKEELVDKPLPRDVESKIEETLGNTLSEILSFEKINLIKEIKEKEKKPFVIAFFGINGSGKTTSIAKLTHYLQKNGLSVVLAACDTFRAAAIQQLEEHAQKLGVKMIKHDYGSDAAAVAFDAIKFAQKNNIEIVMIDTAGRLHSNTNLMQELQKIIRVTKPDLKLFVGESITGNDCIEQARKFNELTELDGIILTKADVDEKGGAPLSIAYTIKKPILFLGMGQKYSDLEEFDREKMMGRLGL